jgi:pyruvate kinase
MMRHTKIIATVGPASGSREVLDALVTAGVDVFRLNFSHGTHESHAESFARVREIASHAGRHVGIMQDLSGPKIRTGPLEGDRPLPLKEGESLVLAAGHAPSQPGRIFTPYAELVRSAQPGDRLLLDDGRIELRVVGRSAAGLEVVVVHGGALGGHKGINAPGVALPPSALTEKDIDDLHFGLRLGVDFVALSFVQTAEDVARARDLIDRAGRSTPLIAKIERPAAVRNLEAILRIAQGVMVARGDLGLEMPLEQVPRVQKEIIRCARFLGLPAIVATQVFESMRVEPRPTRAEVSDAANAVDEGADAIMLAGETAAGAFPVRAVQMLDAVIRDAELMPPPVISLSGSGLSVSGSGVSVSGSGNVPPAIDSTSSRHGQALAHAAVTLATTGQADAIVAVTTEGRTARLISACRPAAPILAATPNAEVAGSLSLLWGVVPFITTERGIDSLTAELVDRRLLAEGAVVVFINVSPEQDRADANFLHVRKVSARGAP